MSAVDREVLRAEDEEARATAQREFGAPLVLEAGAGTGKTATLVARIVVWCLGPGWEKALAQEAAPPDRIAARVLGRVAAITFTEAAAAEMAQRVEAALVEIEAGGRPVGLDTRVLPSEAALVKERARALVSALDHLVVRTIHAWCRRILARRPLDAGLHPAFEVDPEGEVRGEFIREELEAELRRMVSGERGNALLEVAAEGVSPSDVEAALEALFDEGVSVDELEADPLGLDALDARVAALLGRLAQREEVDAGRLGELGGGNKRSAAAATSLADLAVAVERIRSRRSEGGAADDALAIWRELQGALEASLPEAERKKLAAWAKGTLNKGESAAIGADADRHTEASGRLLDEIEGLLDLDIDALVARRRLLLPLHRRVSDRLREQGVLGFSDLLTATRDLLETAPQARARIRREIELLVVDEFQDTDPVQCAILRRLALDGPEEERPSLFLVGDPKQSIYGWRSADLRAYSAFVREVEESGGRRFRLSVNFRSVPAILDEVERSLRPVMREEGDLQQAFQPLLACEDLAGASGFTAAGRAPIEFWVSSDWDAEGQCLLAKTAARRAAGIEAEAIARDLRALHDAKELEWGDAALLFRARGDQETYLAALREAGIPYLVEKDQSYYRRREVIDAAAVLRCILDPNDQVALVAALRSPAVGVPDAAWLPLFAAGLPERLARASRLDDATRAELLQTVERAAQRTPEAAPGQDALRAWPALLTDALFTLVDLRERFELDPSDRFVEALRSGLLPEAIEGARFLGEFRVANLDRFFDELSQGLRDGGDPKAILRRLRTHIAEGRKQEERRPLESSTNAVRVLTIHQAKGLDFGHVYLPQLHKSQGRGAGTRDRVERRATGLEARLLGCATPGLQSVLAEQKEVEDAERVRTLYVALTRAKLRLVLLGKLGADGGAESRTLLELLQGRADNPRPLGVRMQELAAEGRTSLEDSAGALWCFPALLGEDAAAAREEREVGEPAPAASDEVSIGLRERVEAARRRSRRRRVRSASDLHDPESGEGRHESRALESFGADSGSSGEGSAGPEGVPDAGREHAMLAGTAVHRLLEEWRFEGEGDAQLETQLEALRDRLHRELEPEDAESVLDRVREILAAFRATPLFGEFHGMGPRIVAREVPVVRTPDPADDGAAAWVETGSIDLVYRCAEDDRLVVADYKTDRVEDEAAIEACRERYAEQGRFYCEALARALSLDETPRFELWLLRAGRKVACEWSQSGR